MNKKVKLKITTLTPVTIGSGDELSPYSDYLIDDNQVCFIDKQKMHDKIMQRGEKFFNLYIEGVATKMDNNRSDFNLKSFLTNYQIIKSVDDIISYRCPFVGNAASKLSVKGLIKSPLQEPYFPGSSIKGALKTVLMYNWLKTNEKGGDTIKKVVYEKNFDSLEKQFDYKENNITHEVVSKNTIQQITDSSHIPKENIIIVDCYRKMPIRFECIAKNNTAVFELTLENYKWGDLANQINKYAEDALEREFALINEKEDRTDYYNHLVDLENFIVDNSENIALLRLGFGKGYYLNSLGLAIYNYVKKPGKENLYSKFSQFINEQFAKNDEFGIPQEIDIEEFPKTRLFITSTQEPLGWVKIEQADL